jgi:hypothetical protein
MRYLLAALASCLLWSCWGGEDPAGSEVENEMTLGRLYLADGKPAAHARIRLYPVDYLPDPGALRKRAEAASPAYSTFTDDRGRYFIDSLPAGEYNILGDRDGERSLRDSVYLSRSPQTLPPDTLDETGSIAGVVALQPNHDLRTVTLQLLGTNEYANADRQGRFTFGNLAEGRYRLRVTTTEEGYTPLFAGLVVGSGSRDTLADTLRPDFTGIPVVMGVRAVFDTVSGVARLSWHAVDYPRISRYQVFRDLAGSQVLTSVSIGSTRDTVFADTLFRNGSPGLGWPDDTAFRVEYRVRVVNLSDVPGPTFGAVEVAVAPPRSVTTALSLRLSDGTQEASLGDSLVLIGGFDNPTRGQRELRWYALPERTLLRTAVVEGRSGTDTLRILAPREPGRMELALEATDEAGTIWQRLQGISIVADAPEAFAGPDTSVWYKGSRVVLRGGGRDGYGRIVKREWDIGSRGTFRIAPEGDTAFTVDSVPRQGVPCVLRVTDDDGQTATDTLVIRPIVSRIVSSMPSPGYDMSAVAHDGKILLFGGVLGDTITREVVEFDPAAGTWIRKAPMPTPRRGTSAAVSDGKVYVIAGREPDIPGVTRQAWTWGIYDPLSDSWSQIPGMFGAYPAIMTSGGNVYALVGGGILSYSQEQSEWKQIGFSNCCNDWTGIAEVQGSVLVFNYDNIGGFDSPAKVYVHVLNPSSSTSRQKGIFGVPSWGNREIDLHKVAVIGTKVYLLNKGSLVSYESVHNVDRLEPELLLDRSDVTMVALNGKLYFIGGSDPKTGALDPRVEEYIPLD